MSVVCKICGKEIKGNYLDGFCPFCGTIYDDGLVLKGDEILYLDAFYDIGEMDEYFKIMEERK